MVQYNKAIRDHIPEIVKESGIDCVIKILSDKEFLIEIEKKLKEEVDEYLSSKSVTELVDIIEVVYRIAKLRKVSKDELEKIRLQKRNRRGGFNKNLFLVETIV